MTASRIVGLVRQCLNGVGNCRSARRPNSDVPAGVAISEKLTVRSGTPATHATLKKLPLGLRLVKVG